MGEKRNNYDTCIHENSKKYDILDFENRDKADKTCQKKDPNGYQERLAIQKKNRQKWETLERFSRRNDIRTLKSMQGSLLGRGLKPRERYKVRGDEINGIRPLVKKNNPYFQDEQLTKAKLDSGNKTVDVEEMEARKIENEFKDGVLLIPDSHGDMERYNLVKNIIKNKPIDWFAIEMLPHTMQETINQYIEAGINTEEFKKAKSELISYFSNSWNSKFEGKTNPKDNQYLKLLALCKKKGVKVKAMDVSSEYYSNSPMMDDLIVGTRNKIWSEQIPEKGMGIVFGGSAHFSNRKNINVQDFLDEKRKDFKMVTFN